MRFALVLEPDAHAAIALDEEPLRGRPRRAPRRARRPRTGARSPPRAREGARGDRPATRPDNARRRRRSPRARARVARSAERLHELRAEPLRALPLDLARELARVVVARGHAQTAGHAVPDVDPGSRAKRLAPRGVIGARSRKQRKQRSRSRAPRPARRGSPLRRSRPLRRGPRARGPARRPDASLGEREGRGAPITPPPMMIDASTSAPTGPVGPRASGGGGRSLVVKARGGVPSGSGGAEGRALPQAHRSRRAPTAERSAHVDAHCAGARRVVRLPRGARIDRRLRRRGDRAPHAPAVRRRGDRVHLQVAEHPRAARQPSPAAEPAQALDPRARPGRPRRALLHPGRAQARQIASPGAGRRRRETGERRAPRPPSCATSRTLRPAAASTTRHSLTKSTLGIGMHLERRAIAQSARSRASIRADDG